MIEIRVTVSGPFFRPGYPQYVFAAMSRDIRDAVAAQGAANVHRLLDARLRNPTPYYETQITTTAYADRARVHDRGIVYGPWLEGTGSRNSPVTRFGGYHSFRDATRELRRQAQPIADAVAARWVAKLN